MDPSYCILTALGQAMVAEAIATGADINLMEMAVGDAEYSPSTGQTDLMNEVARFEIFEILRDDNNPNWLRVMAVIPPGVGGWHMHELGVFAENGNLFAVAKLDGSYKPVYADGMLKEIALDVILEVSSEANVNLVVDPNVILATRKWVEEYAGVKFTSLKALLDEHAGRRDNPHETGAAQVGAYTQAEVDGLLAAIYDTFQAQLAAQEEAPGTIHLYSGPLSGIKAGWALCDGLEGRPDLADKFILGTAVEEEIGQTGGQGSHTHSVSGTVTGTALTVAQMPAHDHTVTALGAAGGTSFEDGSGWSAYFGPITTSSAGSGQAHGHGLNVAAQAASNLPPYYKLAFIIKL